ncbi:MAG: hypothetical protein AAGI91_13315 [Bacteroidota bacterium]
MDPVPFTAGIVVALATIAAGRVSGFDRDRSFYPTVLAVIALLYVLFGVESGAPAVVSAESVVAFAFVAVAVLAVRRRSALLLAAGLALHGLWDLAHPALLPASDAVPGWWPAFCFGVDLPLAAWAYARWPPRSHVEDPAPSRGVGPAAP